MNISEFDQFADEYSQMLKDSTSSFGEEITFFAEYKIKDLKDLVQNRGLQDQTILDFGSGTGSSIPFFRKYFPNSNLSCIDVSQKSLEVSQSRFGQKEQYGLITDQHIPYADESFNLVFTTCVFHHIPADEHHHWLGEMKRVLKKGGVMIIFEHNPYNPLTLRTVNQCPFDENAVLISQPAFTKKLHAVGLQHVSHQYRLFFPGFLSFARGLEKFLTWCPIGAQYFVYGFK